MKCPLEIISEFSEFSNTCQECNKYKDCLNKCYDSEKEDKRPSGENFPTYGIEHIRAMRNSERRQMVEKLLIENLGKITQDDIIDIGIDIEIYNKQCRKEIIKRQYKKRIKLDDNI